MKKLIITLLIAFTPLIASAQIFRPVQGGTGIGSATAGQVGSCFKVYDDVPFTLELGFCGGGGSGGGTFSTTTSNVAGQLINYPNNATDIVTVGSNSTTTAEFWFDPNISRSFLTYASSTGLTAVTGFFTNLFIGADTLAEYISDTAGAFFTGNTETGITLTYQDADNTVDAVCDTASASVFGCLTSASFSKFNSATTTFTSPLNYTLGTNAVTLDTTGTWSGNAGTATALAANGANCSAGSYPLGVDASGAVEDCTVAGAGGTSAFEIATTSDIAVPNVAYFTKTSGRTTLGSIATGTIAVPTGLTITANRYALGGSATIGLDTGYVIPLQSTLDAKALGATTLTVAGTANQITSSAGAQDLSANRTWTLSLPNLFIIPSNASSTLFSTSYASSTLYYGAGLATCNGASDAITWTAGIFGCNTISAAAASNPFEVATTSNIALSQVAYIAQVGGRTTLASVATSSLAVGSSISSSGTLGYQIGGTASTLSLNMANPNIWTALQTFGNASTSILSAHWLKVGATASTTIDTAGNVALPAAGTLTIPALTSAILQTDANGLLAEYAGTSCTNQFVRSISALGIATCATVGATDVSLANLTATDSTLTFSGTYNGATARTIGLNLGNANTWTVNQTFNYSSSTLYSSFNVSSSTTSIIGTLTGAIITATQKFVGVISETFTPTTEGESGADTTSNQFKYYSGSAVRVLTPDIDSAFVLATSSMGTGTTTIKTAGFSRATTFGKFGCSSSGSGTFVARFGDSTSSSTAVVSATGNTTTFTTISANNAFTAGEAIWYEIGSVSGSVVNPSCSYNRTITAD